MNEWDEYWSEKESVSKRIYDIIAVVYRAVVIKPNLRRYIRNYYLSGDRLLHAGCGGGGVEQHIPGVSVTGLDISDKALQIYRAVHKDPDLVQGTIKNLCFQDETFDGIYNLGVMEHFSDEELRTILSEFNRVLKKDGTVILFWAHSMGSTVIFLHYVHYFLNTILKRDVHLHPAEPNLIRSVSEITPHLSNTGFIIEKTEFNIYNLYTYMIIVLKKESSSNEM